MKASNTTATPALTDKEEKALTSVFCNAGADKVSSTLFLECLQRVKFNLALAPDLWNKLISLQLATAPAWIGGASKAGKPLMLTFTQQAYCRILPQLTPDDMKGLIPVDRVCSWDQEDQYVVFRRFLTDTARGNTGEDVTVEASAEEHWPRECVEKFISRLGKLAVRWIELDDPHMASARKALPKTLQSKLWSECMLASGKLCEKTVALLKTYSPYFKNESSIHPHDRMMPESALLFMEFLRHGNPENYIGRIGEDQAEHELLAAVIALKNGKPTEALRRMRAALKLATPEKFFFRAHENWLYGAVVYLNRESASGKKAAETILRSLQKRRLPQAMPLELLCRLALLEDAGPVFNRCMNEAVKDPDAQLILRMTAFHFHLLDAKTHPLDTTETKVLDCFPVLDLQMGAARGTDGGWIQKRSEQLGIGVILPAVKKVELWENALDRIINNNAAAAAKVLKNRGKEVKKERVGSGPTHQER